MSDWDISVDKTHAQWSLQEGDTLLHVAARRKCVDTAQWLMFAGADPMTLNKVSLRINSVQKFKSDKTNLDLVPENNQHTIVMFAIPRASFHTYTRAYSRTSLLHHLTFSWLAIPIAAWTVSGKRQKRNYFYNVHKC